jgi:hypothetical protein
MPLWSGTRRLVIFSAQLSRFVGEYRGPAIHSVGIDQITTMMERWGGRLATPLQRSECLQEASSSGSAARADLLQQDDAGRQATD